MLEPPTYDPLDYENLGKSVVNALLTRFAIPMRDLRPFNGAGVYAIYYSGDYSEYRPLAANNQNGIFNLPIYVGKAISKGARQGGRGEDVGSPLFGRLIEHAESIHQASSTLNIDHFNCRFLVVTDVWIPLSESMLIERYRPLWNVVVAGFGNHHPGGKRLTGERPKWDTIHPGRSWARNMEPNRYSVEQILTQVRQALSNYS